MDLNQMIARLDSLRAGGRERQDEDWRAWLQSLPPEEALAVQEKINTFSRDEMHLTSNSWDEEHIDTLAQAPEPMLAISEALRAYIQALYQASLVREKLRALLDDLPGSSKP